MCKVKARLAHVWREDVFDEAVLLLLVSVNSEKYQGDETGFMNMLTRRERSSSKHGRQTF